MTATGTAPARTPLDTGRLRARLASGEPTVGTFLGMASPVAAEVCAAAGPDWVLLDLEHGGGGEEQVGATVLAAGAYGVPTVVRVETDARIRLGRVLDLGAAGVMLPRLSSAAEAAQAVRHLRYPPRGDRGVATYNRACRFGLDPGALDRADGEVLCVVQVESAAAVAQADAIAALDGVDVLFVGPRDLSHDLGVPGDVTAPAYLRRWRRSGRPPTATAGLARSPAPAPPPAASVGRAGASRDRPDSTLLAAALAALAAARTDDIQEGGR
jgi:2-dehydro-3-deoxyglucarate aldolase/4-hydroxy-2-oxoheptanedioate aldolase